MEINGKEFEFTQVHGEIRDHFRCKRSSSSEDILEIELNNGLRCPIIAYSPEVLEKFRKDANLEFLIEHVTGITFYDFGAFIPKGEEQMARTLQDVLNNELSADKMGDYTPNELADFLVKNSIVSNAADVNRLVIEGIQKALNEDDEFPIKYYEKDEPMSEAGKQVDPGPCLTDEYIENAMNE